MGFIVMAASPAANISPLKFRGWLQRHVAQIEKPDDESQIILLVYVTHLLMHALPAKKMALVVEELRKKNPSLLSVEIFKTDAPMTSDQLAAAVQSASVDIHAMSRFQQWYGFIDAQDENEVLDSSKVVCVVANIVQGNQKMLKENAGLDFPLGTWVVTTSGEKGVVLKGPFDTETIAKEFATKECGAHFFLKDKLILEN